jgi:predicted negative regulator of RcsB-dependent stress response
MEKIVKFFKENRKGIIWFLVILLIAWLAAELIQNWEIAQEGFNEGYNR